jgi:HK97 gp10 family phage protein
MDQNNWIDIELNGADNIIQKLEQMKTGLKAETERIMLQAAMILEAEIKRQITNMELVDTGTLRASVFSFVRNQFGVVDGVAATNIEYASFLEYGTGQRGAESNYQDVPQDYNYGESAGIRAYKYMWTAWENKKDQIVAFLEKEFIRVVGANAQIAASFRS